MASILEKPVAPVPPSDLLRRRHRWEYWSGFLVTLLVGLTATFLVLGAIHRFWPAAGSGKIMAGVWAGGILLTILAALLERRFAPSSLLDTAQQMDRNLTAKNRLEAAATLHGSTSYLAQAQREETAAYLGQHARHVRPVKALPWLAAVVVLLIVAHLAMVTSLVLPGLLRNAAPVPPPAKPPVPQVPTATITWQSPEPESKANPVEEVPTVAIAQSTSGLKNLSLEISVNGVPKASTPLPATPFDQPGKNTLKTSLYMDELGVEPFDVVAYYIQAHRITGQTVPDTTSAIQFIQVRPFRDDVTQMRGGEGLNKAHALLTELKLGELRSIKENFVLAHTDLPVTDPVRAKENDRVGKNQGDLAAKTKEVAQAFMQQGVSPDIIDLVQQAEAPMTDASRKILATQNNQALPSQQKALSLIVQVEKFFHKIMADKGSAPPSSDPQDPFKDKQQHELKKRMALAAGQLETLSRNQTKLSDDLSHPDAPGNADSPPIDTPNAGANPPPGTGANPSPAIPPGPNGNSPDDSEKEVPLPPTQAVDPFGPDADKGTLAARQARIVQGIEALLNGNKVFPQAVQDALQGAQKDATASMQELDQPDEAGARQPAANAAQDLLNAIAEMLKAGDQETKQTMEASQQKLNDLAQQLRDLAQNGSADAQQKMADLAGQIHDLKQQLEHAADKQQESGSAPDAQRLNHLAKAISDQKVEPDLAAMAKTGLDANKTASDAEKLDALASQAAQGTIPGKASTKEIADLINSMERSRANLARLAQQVGASVPSAAHAGSGKDLPGPGQQRGQGQMPGQGQGHSQEPNGPSEASGSGGSNGAPGTGDPEPGPRQTNPAVLDQAYRDVLANLRDEAQMTNVTVPDVNAADLLQAVTSAGGVRVRTVVSRIQGPACGFEGIVTPLDRVIFKLKQALALAQRNEVVKQPDPDEAPPAYRPAVSEYFEKMSKDYHPDNGDGATHQP